MTNETRYLNCYLIHVMLSIFRWPSHVCQVCCQPTSGPVKLKLALCPKIAPNSSKYYRSDCQFGKWSFILYSLESFHKQIVIISLHFRFCKNCFCFDFDHDSDSLIVNLPISQQLFWTIFCYFGSYKLMWSPPRYDFLENSSEFIQIYFFFIEEYFIVWCMIILN